jgi:hypothetical protein
MLGDLVSRRRDACGAWLVVVGVVIQGCGGTSSADETAAATSGPAQGASQVVLSNIGTDCAITGITTWSIPAEGSTSASSVGAQVVDDVDGASVDCSVKQVGTGFSVLATLQSADSVVFAVGADDIAPSTSGNAYRSTGDISHYAPNTKTMRGIDCTITVSRQQGAQIGPGKVWADFTCPAFNPTTGESASCAATGTFVFGNCAK